MGTILAVDLDVRSRFLYVTTKAMSQHFPNDVRHNIFGKLDNNENGTYFAKLLDLRPTLANDGTSLQVVDQHANFSSARVGALEAANDLHRRPYVSESFHVSKQTFRMNSD
jgi:hypothetical protein